jgi:hypothetical protein
MQGALLRDVESVSQCQLIEESLAVARVLECRDEDLCG